MRLPRPGTPCSPRSPGANVNDTDKRTPPRDADPDFGRDFTSASRGGRFPVTGLPAPFLLCVQMLNTDVAFQSRPDSLSQYSFTSFWHTPGSLISAPASRNEFSCRVWRQLAANRLLNARSTRPVRGFGPNDVDLRGTRSPYSAIVRTASNGTGFRITAVPAPAAPTASTALW